MRLWILGVVLAVSFSALAELEIKEVDGRGIGRSSGGTLVQKGNTKGQSFVLRKAGTLEGVSLAVGSVGKTGNVQLSVFRTEGGFPRGDALHSESGKIPEKLKGGEILQLLFKKTIELAPGSYAFVLESDEASLRFPLAQSNKASESRLIRKNQSTRGKWAAGNNKNSGFACVLLGAGMPVVASAGKSPVSAEPSKPVKLIRKVSENVKPLCGKLPVKPNIITCMVDDLGWNQISVEQSTMGTNKKEFKTPNLEKLANGGLSFTHAYAQPNCAPTRAAMLSGQYPARMHNQVYVVGHLNRNGRGGISKQQAKFYGPEQSEDVDAEAITVAEALKRNGYATAHIGKYHVGGHDGEETLPENVGFDINIGGFKQGHQPVCFASKRKKSDEWEFRKLGRGDFDRFAEPYTAAYLKKHGFPMSLEGKPKHVSDAVGDAMEATVAKLHASGRPFYLQLHPYAVHGPVRARPDLKEAAGGSNLAGFVASIDLIVGRLLKAVEDPNGDGDKSDSVTANTIIIFTSDNGGTHGDNFPLRGKKGMFTEGGVRVPLIAYWPGIIPPGTVTDYMVHSVDYYPSYLDLAGKGWMPSDKEHPLDGESFADILRKPDVQRERGALFYLFPGYMDVRAQPCLVAVDEQNGKRYKLLYFYEADAWQLYNLTDDIGEAENLIKAKPELASTMSKKINDWLLRKHPTWQPRMPIDKATDKPVAPPPVL